MIRSIAKMLDRLFCSPKIVTTSVQPQHNTVVATPDDVHKFRIVTAPSRA